MTNWGNSMRVFGIYAVALTLSAVATPMASAAIYTDDLSRCLVSAATDTDKSAFVQWMFAMISLNPSVKPLSDITGAKRNELNKQVAGLMQRLVLEDCHKETVAAVKYEGSGAFESSFEVLGQVAARGLMADPAVQAGILELGKYVDNDKWSAIAKEAGLPDSAPAK